MDSEGKIVSLDKYRKEQSINVKELTANSRKLQAGLIAPAKEEIVVELAPEHKAEPIKNLEDINRITQYLIHNKRYRDNMLFIAGINFGLRAGDLLSLRFGHLINDDYTFKKTLVIEEEKTKSTRNRRKNRHITINNAVIDAVILYLQNTSDVSLSDYMFRSISNNGKNNNEPIKVRSLGRILKKVADELNLNVKISTHTLRKTFCYHQMVMSHHNSRKLLLLQQMLGHSSPMMTLAYIGITNEEIEEAYMKLNLGDKKYNYLVNADIVEEEESIDEEISLG